MKNDEIDPRLFNFLHDLKPVPPRNPKGTVRGRAQFMTEAVSLREKRRHNVWIIFPYKEKLAMNIIVSTLVLVGLLFGGGATAAAAQDDLPNQPLYQVKLMSEEIQLWFAFDPIQQIDLLMEQAQTRLQEMQSLASEGILPPADVTVRAQERIQRALQIAAQLDEESQRTVLQQIQTRLQTQEQQMLQLEISTCTQCVPILQQTREMLRLQLREVENDLIDPGTLQNQKQNQNQNQDQSQEQNQLQINQTPQGTGTDNSSCGNCTPALDGTGQQNGGSPSEATSVQQQNQTQQNNQNGGESPTGSGGGSPTGSGGQGQGGKP